jgi:hypothetical protein
MLFIAVQIHPNDTQAMMLLVSALQQRQIIAHYSWNPQYHPTDKTPFCTIIMTDGGVVGLKRWGRKIAFMDTTFGTNMYGYGLTALVVKDSHSNHWPVAFMLHQANDQSVYHKFLRTVRERAGHLPQGIVTDISYAGTYRYNLITLNESSLLTCYNML